MQKEVVTDKSSPSILHSLRIKQGKTKANPDLVVKALEKLELKLSLVKEEVPGPASNQGVNPIESIEPEPEASYSYYTSKKDKKKKGKSANLTPSQIIKSLALTTDADFKQGTALITKRDKYLESHSRVHSNDFQSLNFPLLAPRNNYNKTCELVKHFDPD